MRAWAFERPKSALWADPGLGKTPTALHVLLDTLYDCADTSRWLVVGPRLVVEDAWPRQLRRWHQFRHFDWRLLTSHDFGLRAEIDEPTGLRTGLTFGEREDKAAVKRHLLGHREAIHLVSFDFLPWLVKALGKNWPYDGIVVDEALFVQNSESDRHKALWHVIENLKAVSRVIELTGAPTPNGYEQLHGQIRLLDGGARLGRTKTEFRDQWLVPDRRNPRSGIVFSWKLANGAGAEIDRRLADLCVSLAADDYLELPERVINPIMVTLPPAARHAYDTLERDLVLQMTCGAEIVAPSEASLAGKLLQIANGQVYDEAHAAKPIHAAKLDALAELIEATEGPILLAYSFMSDWQRISERFGKLAVHVKAPRALDRFRAGGIKLLGMHPASGGHGIDGLQEVSSTAVWYGATYNADHWLQFNARLHRDGQRAGRVVVHQLLAEDTIEEYVAGRVLPDKLNEQDALRQALALRLPCLTI